MNTKDIFIIFGSFGSFLISITLLFWTLFQQTRISKVFWNWMADVYYAKCWYGAYYCALKGCRHGPKWLRSVQQPMLVADLEGLEHFNHVSSKPSTQTCWVILPELTYAGFDGIKPDPSDAVHRDKDGRVMLKINLDQLMQLLVRDRVRLNQHIPWDGKTWRQKTGYGFIELAMRSGIMEGFIKIDPIPYHHTRPEMSMKGRAVKELWYKGYSEFPNDLFEGTYTPGACITLWSELSSHQAGDRTLYALTPSAIGSMLHRFSLLSVVDTCPRCEDLWCTIAVDVNISASMCKWQPEGHDNLQKDLAILAGKLKVTASRVNCTNDHCAAKKRICIYLHNMVAGDFGVRFFPSWATKQEWFGPSAVYFGGT